MLPSTKRPSDSLKAIVMGIHMHVESCKCTFSSFSFLFFMPLAVAKCRASHVHSLFIGQLGWIKHRDTALMSFVLYYSLPRCYCLCLCFPVHQTIVDNKLLCQLREQCFFFFLYICCWSLLSEVKLHYIFRKAPWHVILEPCLLIWCRLSQGSGFSTVTNHLEPQAADRSLLADKSAAQHH